MPDLRDNLQAALGATYTIERELGGGGMSRVFLAVEQSLHRRVVIKVLPPEMAASVSMERFRREIMLAARLQHPHIVPLLSAGETDGVPYLTMPFVDGESLRARLSRGGELPIAEGLRILREVASALDYAHEEGVVHRDIKPDNVLLSHGSAMVTDFGVAKALSASTNADEHSVTSLGVSLGTPAYMSPEQAAASPDIDGRADIYAFGVLAYELFAGRPPFIGRSPQALLAAHVTEAPESIQKLRPSLPQGLAALIMRCLEKRPADRPQSAAEIVAALDAITTPSGGSTPTSGVATASVDSNGGSATKRKTLLGVAVGVVAVVAIALAVANRGHTPAKSAGGRAKIAVLPFTVRGDTASQYFADGLTGELINLLAGLPSVSVVSRSRVFALPANDLRDVAALGKTLGVSLVIEGDVRRTAGTIKVSAELIDAGTSSVVASRSVERPDGDVFTLEDNVAREIVSALEAKLGISIGSATMRRGTSNQDAYDRFLKGEYFANRYTEDDYRRAIDLYQQSIRLDSSFARPWAGMATAWVSLADTWLSPSQTYPAAEAAARKALELDPTLAEAHASLGSVLFMYRRDYQNGYREFQRSVALDSNCATGHMGLAFAFVDFGLRDSALYHARRLIAIDSLSAVNLATAAFIMQLARDVGEAVSTVVRRNKLGPSTVGGLNIATVYWSSGQRAKADSIVRSMCGSSGPPECGSSFALFLRGDTSRARRAYAAELQGIRASGDYVNPVSDALVQLAIGDTAEALRLLEQGLDDRTANVTEIAQMPELDGLRNDARFKKLVHRAGLDVPLLPK